MGKRISKSLAKEIAERTMAVVNPANRGMALRAALIRHGFVGREPEPAGLEEAEALVKWLLAEYPGD